MTQAKILRSRKMIPCPGVSSMGLRPDGRASHRGRQAGYNGAPESRCRSFAVGLEAVAGGAGEEGTGPF